MRRPLRLTALAAGLVFASGAFAASPTTIPADAVTAATSLRDKAMADDTAYKVVTSLTTEVGARLAGSPADQRGRDWAVATFKALGFDKVYVEPVTYPLWERHSEHGAVVGDHAQNLALTALGYSAGTPSGGASRASRSSRSFSPPSGPIGSSWC